MGSHEKPLINEATQRLLANMNEAVKTFSVYDGQSRLTDFYVAPARAQHGDQCLRTTYSYLNTSNLVEKSRDVLATWDSSWD